MFRAGQHVVSVMQSAHMTVIVTRRKVIISTSAIIYSLSNVYHTLKISVCNKFNVD